MLVLLGMRALRGGGPGGFVPRAVFAHGSASEVNWYPGHMEAALRKLGGCGPVPSPASPLSSHPPVSLSTRQAPAARRPCRLSGAVRPCRLVRQLDLLLEVRDARLPFSSHNPAAAERVFAAARARVRFRCFGQPGRCTCWRGHSSSSVAPRPQ